MDPVKRQKLEAAGWKVGSAEEFLELTPAEAALVDFKIALSNRLKECRASHNLSQKELAKKMQSSQSRVAKMEAGDPSVSTDLLIKALFCSGATREDIAEAFLNSSDNSKDAGEKTLQCV